MAQIARPDSDINAGAWSPFPADPATLWDKLDEEAKDDDTTYIVSATDEDEFEIGLGDVDDPSIGTGHKIRCYARVLNGGGAAEQVTISLIENGNVRCADGPHNVSRGAYALIEYTLLEAEANSITNYANLRFRLHINKTDGDEPIRITQVEFECPDAAPAEYVMPAGAGAFTQTGTAVGALKSSRIPIGVDSFAVTGQTVGLNRGYQIPIGAGAFSEAGQAVSLLKSSKVDIGLGTYSLGGQVVDLLKSSKLDIGAGSIALAGQIADLYYNRSVGAGVGAFALTGSNVDLVYTAGATLIAGSGAFALGGQVADLLKSSGIIVSPGSFALNGQDIGLLRDRIMQASSGGYSLSGYLANLVREAKIIAESGSFTISGQPVSLLHAMRLLVGPEAYGLTGKDANLLFVPGIRFYSEWLTGWKHRKKITVQDEFVDSNLTDFPVYVKIDADADFHEARADGFDIRFTLSDGKTLLKYEREYWTGGNGSPATAHFWVKIPSILASDGAIIYVYYGKSDAPDGQDIPNVWDANFKGVWHFAKGSGMIAYDKSGNGNDGSLGNMTEDAWVNGKINKAIQINAKNQYIDIPVFGTTQISISLLYYFSGTGGAWNTLICRETGTYHHILIQTGTNLIGFYNSDFFSSGYRLIPGTWYYIVVIKNGTNSKLYINAVEKQDSDSSFDNAAYPASIIGNYAIGGWQGALGLFDEVRISNIARAVAWHKFEHHNIFEADNEITWGIEESLFPIIFDVVPRRRILDVEARERIYDISPRARILELEPRTRIHNVSPRGRIFDRRST